ncbi:MAG: HEAT repeat domain-containing protein [Acidobacteriota bacterium]
MMYGQATGPVHDLIITLIVIGAAFFLFMLAIILLNKIYREVADRRMRCGREMIEPLLFDYITGTGSIEEHLRLPLSSIDRAVVEQVCFDLGRIVTGVTWERAREALERLGFVDAYIERLKSRRWWSRAEAAEKLGYIGSEKATSALIEHMDDPVKEVRVRIARALGRIGTEEALDHLVEALADAGRWSAIRVAAILIKAGEPAVQSLLRAYASLPFHARISAIDIFGRIRSLRAVPLLTDLLQDPEADIRARAAFALGSIGDPNSCPVLLRALGDESWAVRAMAAKALGRLKLEECVPRLCDALADPQWWVRVNAAEALKRQGRAGDRALLEMLDSQDTYAAQQAVQMLQESGMLDGMISQLGATNEEDRQAALEVMAKLVMLKRTDLLTEMAHNHPEASIRERLSIILGVRDPATTA